MTGNVGRLVFLVLVGMVWPVAGTADPLAVRDNQEQREAIGTATDPSVFRGEINPVFQGFLAFITAAVATDSNRSNLLRLPYAAEALGPGFQFQAEAHATVASAEASAVPMPETVARLRRGKAALEKGAEVLVALERDFLPPSAFPWLLQAHRLSIGTVQEPALVDRIFRHLLANRYPVEMVWKTLQYWHAIERIFPPNLRLNLDPHFLTMELRGLEGTFPGTSTEAVDREPPVTWYPQSPDLLLSYSLLMKRLGQMEAAREAARRHCLTSFWGERSFQSEDRDLLEQGAMGEGSRLPSSEPPEGVKKLILEVSPPLPAYHATPTPPLTRILEWDGRAFSTTDQELVCPGDIVAFLVHQARSASPTTLLPVRSSLPYQVRLTLEFAGTSPILFWSELGPNRWIGPLFLAADGGLRYLDDPEAMWAVLHVFQRNRFLEKLHRDFHQTPCGTDLSAGFLASSGVCEQYPRSFLDAPDLGPGEKVATTSPILYAPQGLKHPVAIQGVNWEKKVEWPSPRSSCFFFRRLIDSGPSPLAQFEEILELRLRLESQLKKLIGWQPKTIHCSPVTDYDEGETFAPERRQLIGFDIEAGIPSGNAAVSVVKILRALGQSLPLTGPFPVPWQFRATWEGSRTEPGIEVSGYWLDAPRTLIIAGLSVSLDGDDAGGVVTQVRSIFPVPAGSPPLTGYLRLIDGFRYTNHSFSIDEKSPAGWSEVADLLRGQAWKYEHLGSGKNRSLLLTPPKGTVFYLLKQLGEPLRMEKAEGLDLDRR